MWGIWWGISIFTPNRKKILPQIGGKALASLTDKKIQALKSKDKSYKVYDSDGLFF